MFKKLDILIIRSFIGPFIVTFFVTLFVLVMQFFWLYMDELIGKGLGIGMILQLLLYMSATLVPMALPLGILMASIMTFGSMGENFELVAIKSAGISLIRFMQPLLILIAFIGAGAFLFNNNVIPVANLKALSLLYDLRNSKPTLNIRPGQFNNDIKDFNIRVGSKDKDGRTIRDIIIYDGTSQMGNDKIAIAKSGVMIPSADKQVIIFRLQDGWRYEEGTSSGNNNRSGTHAMTRIHFKSWDKIFDLSSFKVSRTNEELFKTAYQMMNVGQLAQQIDSLKKTGKKLPDAIANYVAPYAVVLAPEKERKALFAISDKISSKPRSYKHSFAELMDDSLRARAMTLALTDARNMKGQLDFPSFDHGIQEENLVKFNIEWHRKFTLSFACILLFLIGAPLGAIIKKGGLGMPLVIAVVFFVVFHITSVIGEKLAKASSVPTWMGMWMATLMLLPIAFVLINQARNDSQIFSREWYARRWNAIVAMLPTKQKD